MICIIGSGLSAMAAAAALAARGIRPTVLDVGIEPAAAAASLKMRLGSVEPDYWRADETALVRQTGPVAANGMRTVNDHLDPEHRATRLTSVPADYLHRMTEAQAQLALGQMESVDDASCARISNASLYEGGLHETDHLAKPRWTSNGSNTYTCYPVRCRERNALLGYAMRHGRDFAAQHLRNCADLPEFRQFYRDCPNARAAARELVLLPTYASYPRAEIQQNIEVVQQFSAALAQGRMPQR